MSSQSHLTLTNGGAPERRGRTRRTPNLVEEFLLTLADVNEAKVWISNERLLARVFVTDTSRVSEVDLQMACRKQLGADHTPQMIVLERCRRKVA